MDNVFLIKLFLSFTIGGSYIALTIWISEKFGSKIGGLLIGLPTTGLISLIFIAWSQNTAAAVSALPIFPAAIAAGSIFLFIFVDFYKYGKITSFIAALALWFILLFPLMFFSIKNIWLSLLIAILFFILSLLRLNKFPYKELPKFSLTKKEFLFRIIFAGSFVGLAVLLGKILGPLWGGLFACFPAAFSSSLFILEKKHGIEFTSSVVKTMPYGSMGNVIFSIALFLTATIVGFACGIIISYLLSLIFALFIKYVIFKK